MQIVGLLVVAIVTYALFGIVSAKASMVMNSNIVAVISNAIGAIIPLAVYWAYNAKKQAVSLNEGLSYAVLAGALIAVFAMTLNYLFAKAENVSFIMPAVYGGVIVVATMLGIVVMKERISLLALAGVGLITVGVCLIVYSRLYSLN